jgi:hypothetical protein
MRRFTAAALAAICVLAAACGGNSNKSSAPSSTAPTSSTPPPPVAAAALDGLLLSPNQVNTAMGATGMTVNGTYTAMYVDSANVADKACLPLDSSAQAPVYAGSGWSAFRGQHLQEPGDTYTHGVGQNVVLFPSADQAGAFFAASAQQWPACANRQYTFTQAGKPDQVEAVGPVSNTNGTLSASVTSEGGNGWTCQRALTVANNVAIDVNACGYNPSNSAVNIAHQIAAKVPT